MNPTPGKPTHGTTTPGGQLRDDRRSASHYTCARCGERCCADDDGWIEMFGCLCLLCLKELECASDARPRASPAAQPAPQAQAGANAEPARKRRRA